MVFLLFMLPLPQSINNMVSLPLQRIATLGSVFVMQLTGLRSVAEGNVILADLCTQSGTTGGRPGLQRFVHAHDSGRHGHGDRHLDSPADLEASRGACKRACPLPW